MHRAPKSRSCRTPSSLLRNRTASPSDDRKSVRAIYLSIPCLVLGIAKSVCLSLSLSLSFGQYYVDDGNGFGGRSGSSEKGRAKGFALDVLAQNSNDHVTPEDENKFGADA